MQNDLSVTLQLLNICCSKACLPLNLGEFKSPLSSSQANFFLLKRTSRSSVRTSFYQHSLLVSQGTPKPVGLRLRAQAFENYHFRPNLPLIVKFSLSSFRISNNRWPGLASRSHHVFAPYCPCHCMWSERIFSHRSCMAGSAFVGRYVIVIAQNWTDLDLKPVFHRCRQTLYPILKSMVR